MVKVFANTTRLPGSNPSHVKNEKRKEKKEREGTMNREPKYGGGAHPKYGKL
jgi:hypothetical protein